jgi:hypothetical protein
VDLIHISSEAISLRAVADETVGGIWTVAAALERTARPFFRLYLVCCYESIRIVTGIFSVSLVSYQHGSPFINAKRALTLTGFSSTVKSAPFGSFILFFDFNLSGTLFHFAVITKGRYP